MNEIAVGQRWRHKKRNQALYEIMETDAKIQCIHLPHLEDEDWIAYRNVDGGKLFFRLRSEFLDGRFERVL